MGISQPLKHVLFSVLHILWCEEHSSHCLAHSQKEQSHLFSLEASRLNPTHGHVITKQSWDTSTHRDTAGSLLQGEDSASRWNTDHHPVCTVTGAHTQISRKGEACGQGVSLSHRGHCQAFPDTRAKELLLSFKGSCL